MPSGKHSPSNDHGRDAAEPARDRGDDDADIVGSDDIVTVEHLLAPGTPARRTRPADHDRYAYVLEGQVVALIGAETLVVGPGSIVSIPRGYHHALRCAGDSAARVLVVHARDEDPNEPRRRRAA
jgi:quercetin dioxygenase-like cupin family protein